MPLFALMNKPIFTVILSRQTTVKLKTVGTLYVEIFQKCLWCCNENKTDSRWLNLQPVTSNTFEVFTYLKISGFSSGGFIVHLIG